MKKAVLTLFAVMGYSYALPLIDLELYGGAVRQQPSGFISYKGDAIDLKRDANVGDKTQPWLRLKFEHPLPLIPNIKLGAMPMKLEGKGRLNRNFQFGNTIFASNVDFDLSVKLDRVDATLYYNVPFLGVLTAGILDIEYGLNLRYITFEGKVTGQDTLGNSRTESKSLNIPVPMGHLAAEISPVSSLSILGQLNYISFSGNTYYDYNVGARIKPIGLGIARPFIEAGYREEKLKIDKSEVRSDIKIKGPYVMLGLEF